MPPDRSDRPVLRPSRIGPDILLNQALGLADLSGSPMCVNGMKVLMRARDDGGIKLTGSGAFSRSFVTWAAADFAWPGYDVEEFYAVCKVLNETDLVPLWIMHELMIGSRLLRHYKGRAMPTKAGRAVIGDYGMLQAEMFDAFFLAADEHGFSPFPVDHYEDAGLRHFLALLHGRRLADWVPLAGLAGWCGAIGRIGTGPTNPLLNACLQMRSYRILPALWLGLLEKEPAEVRVPVEEERYRKTPLCDRFLSFGAIHDGGSAVH